MNKIYALDFFVQKWRKKWNNIKKADIIEKSELYRFVGVDTKGNRQFINIYQDRPLNKHFWLDCFENLKSRALKNILFLSVDDNKNIKRTTKIAFPEIVFVDSLTDIAPKFYKYTSERNSREQTNSRNGHLQRKNVKTKYGNIKVQTPRDREATFEPIIIEKGQTRLTGFEDKCIALYAKGMSVRDIEKTLKEIYGVKINKNDIT